MKEKLIKTYDSMAIDYFSHVDEKPWNADYERPATLELIGSVEGKTILDAGCAALVED